MASKKRSAVKKGAVKKTIAKASRTEKTVAKEKLAKIASKVAAKTSKPVRGKARKAADPKQLMERLTRAIPKPEVELAFKTPFELLTSTILAAQSTDRTVNQVMPTLLSRYPDAAALAQSTQEDVETLVKRTGFFRNKAKAIRGMAQALVERHGGQVPRTIEEMVELPGVARKTANVVLGSAYGINSGFIVDTHVTRLAERLALSNHTDPVKIERDLCAVFPQDQWLNMGHRLVLHGRYTCIAKRPLCEDCPINELCPSAQAAPIAPWTDRADHENFRTNKGLVESRGY